MLILERRMTGHVACTEQSNSLHLGETGNTSRHRVHLGLVDLDDTESCGF
jgi:hypothetical protein